MSSTYFMRFHEVSDCIQVTMYGFFVTELGLHLVQPVQQGLHGFLELAREQQSLLKLTLPATQKKQYSAYTNSTVQGKQNSEQIYMCHNQLTAIPTTNELE